jgi:hypothetical protein
MNGQRRRLGCRHGWRAAVVIGPRIALRDSPHELFCGIMTSIGWALG